MRSFGVSFLGCQLQKINLVENEPRRLDFPLPLDYRYRVKYILVHLITDMSRTRDSRDFCRFILQIHIFKNKQLWNSNNTGLMELFHNFLLLPIGVTSYLQRKKPLPKATIVVYSIDCI